MLDAVDVTVDRIFGSFGGQWNVIPTAADFALPPSFQERIALTSFQRISRNHYNVEFVDKPKALSADDIEVCACNADDRCAENCPNRAMFVECSARCAHGATCQNQRIKRRQWAHTSVKMTADRGGGLFASEPIVAGRLIIEYVGEIIDGAECAKRLDANKFHGKTDFYMFQLSKDCVIDAGPMGSDARFANHSCDPNAKTELWHVGAQRRVGLFALRNIAAGEEITYDYHCQGFWSQGDEQQCKCNAFNCRRHLGAKPVKQDKRNKAAQSAPSNIEYIIPTAAISVLTCSWLLPTRAVDLDDAAELLPMIQRRRDNQERIGERKRQRRIIEEQAAASVAAATDETSAADDSATMSHDSMAVECDDGGLEMSSGVSPVSTLSSSPLRSPPLSPVATANGGAYVFGDASEFDLHHMTTDVDADADILCAKEHKHAEDDVYGALSALTSPLL